MKKTLLETNDQDVLIVHDLCISSSIKTHFCSAEVTQVYSGTLFKGSSVDVPRAFSSSSSKHMIVGRLFKKHASLHHNVNIHSLTHTHFFAKYVSNL